MVNRYPPTRSFVLPDLLSYCPFPIHYRENSETLAQESDKWLDVGCPNLAEDKRRNLYGVKAGHLAAYCYPGCDEKHFRVVTDFLNILFHLDNVSDGMMKTETEALANVVMNVLRYPRSIPEGLDRPEEIAAATIVRDFWTRCIQDAGPNFQLRFCENMSKFFEAVHVEVQSREKGSVPDLDSYTGLRRDLSACKPSFDLIEYGLGIDLPDAVVTDPIITAMNDAANDLIIWSNDLYSYNVEQARGDTHNVVSILIKHHGLDLQSAADRVGDMWLRAVQGFCENKKRVPTWGPAIDGDVAKYIQGLEDWIVGSVQWSFSSERYFGKDGPRIKTSRLVRLIEKRVPRNAF